MVRGSLFLKEKIYLTRPKYAIETNFFMIVVFTQSWQVLRVHFLLEKLNLKAEL